MSTPHRATGLTLAALIAVSTFLAVLSVPARAATILSEDFESGVLGPQWTAADNVAASGLDYWDVTSFRVHAGSYSAWSAAVGTQAVGGQPNTAVNKYDNDMEADLSYAIPPGYFSLSLSLYLWAKGEGGGGDLFQVWYVASGIPTKIFENRGRAAWDFVSMAVPSNADTLILRWRSDAANNNFEGAYVDDIVLTGNFGAPDANPPWSNVLALPVLTNLATYPIPYTAQDGVNETGVAYVELWYRQGVAGNFTLYVTGGNPLGQWTTSPVPFDSTVALGDGYYEFYSVAVDNATNVEAAPGTADAFMTIDSTAPALAILSPANGTWFSIADVNATWNGTDALSGLDRFETGLDGSPLVSVGLAINQTFAALPEGLHSVDLAAYDFAGNAVLLNVSFGVDLTDPSLAVTAPVAGTWLGSANVNVSWTGSDVPSGIDRYETSLDAGPFVSNGPSNSTSFAGLAEGLHTVDVLAYDLAGRMATDSVNFSVDLSPPSVSVSSPASGSWFGASSVTVTWTGSDALSGVDRYETRLDAGAFVPNGLNVSAPFAGLLEGPHTVEVWAFDAVGNVASASVTFSVDLSDPILTVLTPASGAWLATPDVTVVWAGSDALSGLDHYETSLDSGPFGGIGLATSRLFPALPDGPHAVDVLAFDVVGRQVTASVAFAVDGSAPTVSVTSPASGAWLGTGTVAVSWTGADPVSGLDHYETRLDAAAFTAMGLATSQTLLAVTEGPHTFSVMAYDVAGNSALATRAFSIDLTPPVVSLTAPSPGSWFAAGTVVVTWTGSDARSGLDHYEVSVDGGPYVPSGMSTTQTLSGLSEGAHTAAVRAYDAVGFFATGSVGFSVDLTPPIVAVSSPASGTWSGSASVAVTWTGSDALSGVEHYETRLDGASFSPVGLAATQTFSALAEGAHTVEVRAFDVAGQWSTISVSFSVDLTPPIATLLSPSAGGWLNTASVSVTWSGSDARSGIDRYETSVDGASFVSSGLTTNRMLTSLAEGPHTLDLRATDRVGRVATASGAFSIDLTPPAVAVTAPAAGAWFGAAPVTVLWDGSDGLSGLARFESDLDNASATPEGLAVNRTYSGLGEGVHSFEVGAFDAAGNSATATVVFGIDTSAPSVSIVSPAEGQVLTTPAIVLDWAGSDPSSGIDHYEVIVDGGTAIVTTSLAQALSALPDGTHTVVVRAVDTAGNSQDARLTFRINTNVFSWDGPFGPWLLLSLILLFILLPLLLLLLLWRRRKEEEEKEDPVDQSLFMAPMAVPADGDADSSPPPPDASNSADSEETAEGAAVSAETSEPEASSEPMDPGAPDDSTDAPEPEAPDPAAQAPAAPEPAAPESAPEREPPEPTAREVAPPAPALAAMAVSASQPSAPAPAEMARAFTPGGSRCSSCHGTFRAGFSVLNCPSCSVSYHESCGSRISQCAQCGVAVVAPS